MALLVGCHVEGAEGYKLAKVSVRRRWSDVTPHCECLSKEHGVPATKNPASQRQVDRMRGPGRDGRRPGEMMARPGWRFSLIVCEVVRIGDMF